MIIPEVASDIAARSAVNRIPPGCRKSAGTCNADWAAAVEGLSGEALFNAYNAGDQCTWTESYHPEGALSAMRMKEFVESLAIWSGVDMSNQIVVEALNALPDRGYFTLGGSVAGRGGGAPAALEVDVLVSPYLLPDVSAESFKIEPVLRAGFMPALRPGDLGGIELHPSRYATMRVMSIDGKVKYATTNFILDHVSKDTRENFSVKQSFHGTQLEFNKERYRIYTFNMSLIDSRNFDWDRAFELSWQQYMRGAVLAARKWRWYLLEGARLYGGYPLAYSHRKSAAGEPVTGLALQVYITDDIPLPEMRMYPAPGFSARNGYYRWKGDTFVEGADVNMNAIKDYEPQVKPSHPDEVEYSDEGDVGFGDQGGYLSGGGVGTT